MPKRSADQMSGNESILREEPAPKKNKLSDGDLVKSYANKWAEEYRRILEEEGQKAAKKFEEAVYYAIGDWMMEDEGDYDDEEDESDAEEDSQPLQKAKTPAAAALVKAFAKGMVKEFRVALECGRGALRRLDDAIAYMRQDDEYDDEDDEEDSDGDEEDESDEDY